MLAYVLVVTGRGTYCLREARAHIDTLKADLSRIVTALQSIAFAAPYLGLAGTCFGILDSFRGVGMQRDAARAMLTTYIAASLLTTASGLLVVFSAASSFNYLLWRINRLESELARTAPEPMAESVGTASEVNYRHRYRCCGIFSKYPLRGQFSRLPAFALIAVPSLAMALAAFMSFSSFRSPTGLEVRLLALGSLDTGNNIQPLFIGLLGTGADEKPDIYLNLKKTTWDDLDNSLLNNLRTRPQPIVYVEADIGVQWAYVAMVIDSVKAYSDDVILLTIAPEVGSGHTQRCDKSKK